MDEVYQLRIFSEETNQEIGSVSLVIPATHSGLFWALNTASSQIGHVIRGHRARQRAKARMSDGA